MTRSLCNSRGFFLVGTVVLLAAAGCSADSGPRPFSGDLPDASAPMHVTPTPSAPSPNSSASTTATMPRPSSSVVPTTPRPVPTPPSSNTAQGGESGVGGEGQGGASGSSAGEGGTSSSEASSALLDAGLPDVPEPIVFGDYSVVCDDRNNGQTSSAQFSVALTLVNNTEEWIPVEELSVRYYFTSDNEHDPTLQGHLVFIDDASPTFGERNNVFSEVSALDPVEEGAEYYVELSFGPGNCSGAPCLWPGNETSNDPVLEQRPIQLRVQIDPSALRYDLTDDYSYNPDANGDVLCENITLYRNGRLIFGVEPDGTVPEPLQDGGVPEPVDGGVDAGPGLPVDAGVPDAGPSPDASTPTLVDAGPDLDASLPDAGVVLDGGPTADASATATATP